MGRCKLRLSSEDRGTSPRAPTSAARRPQVQHSVTDLHAANQINVVRTVRVGGQQDARQWVVINFVILRKNWREKKYFLKSKVVDDLEILCDHVCKHLICL